MTVEVTVTQDDVTLYSLTFIWTKMKRKKKKEIKTNYIFMSNDEKKTTKVVDLSSEVLYFGVSHTSVRRTRVKIHLFTRWDSPPTRSYSDPHGWTVILYPVSLSLNS